VIRFLCPHCGFALFAPAGCEGNAFRCLQCKKSVIVPRGEHAEPPPVTSQTIVGEFVGQFPAAAEAAKLAGPLSPEAPPSKGTMMGQLLMPPPGPKPGAPPPKLDGAPQPLATTPARGNREMWVPVLLATNALLLLALVVALVVIIFLMLYLGKAPATRAGQAFAKGTELHCDFRPELAP
jgi:hypothetical protein